MIDGGLPLCLMIHPKVEELHDIVGTLAGGMYELVRASTFKDTR